MKISGESLVVLVYMTALVLVGDMVFGWRGALGGFGAGLVIVLFNLVAKRWEA